MSYLNQIYKLNIMNGMWRLLIICPCGVYWLLIYINNGWNQPIGICFFPTLLTRYMTVCLLGSVTLQVAIKPCDRFSLTESRDQFWQRCHQVTGTLDSVMRDQGYKLHSPLTCISFWLYTGSVYSGKFSNTKTGFYIPIILFIQRGRLKYDE